MADSAARALPTDFSQRRLILCVGPGGVGKTSCAAALALAESERGRKVAVLTVDPSHRLAQALQLNAEPGSTGPARFVPGKMVEVRPGLDAMMLDAGSVFESIVKESCDEKDGSKILENRFYRATARQLTGALEYAAMAQVQMLAATGRYDLIVLDTPPTADAMELLAAPSRVRELLENPAAKVLLGTGRLGGRFLSWGSKGAISKVFTQLAGGTLLMELGEFLKDFSGVIEIFHKKGGDFEKRLRAQSTTAVMVTSPAPFSIREAELYLTRLSEMGIQLERVILNQAELPEEGSATAGAAAFSELSSADALVFKRAQGDASLRIQQSRDAVRELGKKVGESQLRVLPRRVHSPQNLDELLELGQLI